VAFAVIDPTARQCVGVVAERRFTAFLSPFQDEASATAALKAAGASKVAPYVKRKAALK
jgi:hypothetical protein